MILLDLYDLEKRLSLEDVRSLEGLTQDGEPITILPGHAPLVCILQDTKPLKVVHSNGEQKTVTLESGSFLSVSPQEKSKQANQVSRVRVFSSALLVS